MNDNEQEQLSKIEEESLIEEKLRQNSASVPVKRTTKEDLATYAAMGLILIAAIVLVYIFLDKQGANPFKKTTTTSTPVHTFETTQEQYIEPKTITTTTTTTKSANVQGTTNIDAGADRVEPTTFHTVQTTN